MDKNNEYTQKGSRADIAEIERFAKIADTWWDENGPFKALHAMNPPRIAFIYEQIIKHYPQEGENIFAHLDILDAGCGGGILTEALYKKGAKLTGVDATEESLNVAKAHAQMNNLDIDYHLGLVDDMDDNHLFDIICSLEVVEHLPDVSGFLAALEKRLKPGGLIFISTINRTPKAIVLAKYAAEYLLNLAPKGTHEWQKFVKPSELQTIAHHLNLEVKGISGFKFYPLGNRWKLCRNVDMNYIICLQKPI
ncbi:MAG: bifunctional 2-polyprenyl-6-hydroxyphenol methylase/3-demethylubiquinol 3-O-methyltransferase UbiG [Alphaproteobacteria bacterium]